MIRILTIGWVAVLMSQTTVAQQFPGEHAWKEIVVYEGVRFLYVFYPRADALNDGVVMMLQNQNEYPIQYQFTIIFESPDGNTSTDAMGILKPLEMKTGDAEGLFWVPFEDERSLGAIRMRNYRITPIDTPTQPSNCDSVCT